MSLLAAYLLRDKTNSLTNLRLRLQWGKSRGKGEKGIRCRQGIQHHYLRLEDARHERPHRQSHLSGYPENALGSCLKKD